MATSVMNYHGSSSLRLTGGITKSRTKTISRMDVANPKKLKNARKMLFGPVDRDETRRIVETQLKKHVLDATSRWGFDFSADQPIRSPEAKYVWERVPPLDDSLNNSSSSSGPGPVMTLSSAAHVRTIQVVAMSPSSTASTLSSAHSSLVSSPSTSMCNSDLESDLDVSGGPNCSHGDLNGVVEGSSSNEGTASKRMVQKKMTDFMKEKKRTNPVLVTVAKKRDFAGISAASGAAAATTTASSSRLDDVSSWGADMPPAKRMRTASAASSSSSVGSLS